MDQNSTGCKMGFHLDDIEKTRAMLKAVTASVANPSSSVPVVGSTVSLIPKKKKASKKPPSGDSGNGGDNKPPSGGGNGGSGNGNDPFFSRDELKIGVYCVLFLVGLAVYLLVYGKILEMTKRANDSSASTHQSANQPTTKPPEQVSIIYGTSFSCRTIEEKDAGYASADTQQVNAGESMHLSSGCAAIRINGTAIKLDADKYELVVPVGDGTDYSYKCGNANGHNDSIFSCTDFFNRHAGKTVHAIVKNGGYVHVTLNK